MAAAPKRSYHHGDLERALVAAARTLIERDGAARLSVSAACRMAGVSTAAPYRHFRDKDDLLAHVKKAGFEELTRRMEEAREAAGAMADHEEDAGVLDAEDEAAVRRIAAIGKAYVAFALACPETFALMFGAHRLSVTDEREEEVRRVGQGCFDVLIGEVARFLRRSGTQDEAAELSVMLWSFVHGVAALARDQDYDSVRIPVDVDRLVDRASRAVLAGTRGLAAGGLPPLTSPGA